MSDILAKAVRNYSNGTANYMLTAPRVAALMLVVALVASYHADARKIDLSMAQKLDQQNSNLKTLSQHII